MADSDLIFLNAFNTIRGVGPATLRLIKLNFSALSDAWRASAAELQRAGIPPHITESITSSRPSLDPEKLFADVAKQHAWIVTEDDPCFPPLLKEIPSPPVMIYGRGTLPPQGTVILAAVGTRRPTSYGIRATEHIVGRLADQGIAIASGLAVGIDTVAHKTALASKGTTIAVLGSGISPSSMFPQENTRLASRIADEGGAVISEYLPDAKARREYFPQRNRIISGLSQGVFVAEARGRSGALITARFAMEQNRDVFALPGSIFSPTSQGPNRLIQEGAKLVRSADDILEELGIEYNDNKEVLTQRLGTLTETERTLLNLLEHEAGVDALLTKTSLDAAAILAALSMLELKGIVKRMGSDTYQRII